MSLPNEKVGISAHLPDASKLGERSDTPVVSASQDIVPPEEAVPCSDKEKSRQKLLDQPAMEQPIPEDKISKTEGDETQAILRQLLQRVQQQESSISTLQDTVQSQNATLQALMTTMQTGFASLLQEKQQRHVEQPLKRLISPERDHPTILVASEAAPEGIKDCLSGGGESDDGPDIIQQQPSDLHSDDNSITIQQLPQPIKTIPEHRNSISERPALRVPHRASLTVNHSKDNTGNPSMQMGLASKATNQPVFGKKSSGMLLDDSDSDSDDDNSTITSHDPQHADNIRGANSSQDKHTCRTDDLSGTPGSSIGCNSCRGQLAKKHRFRKHNDRVPSPPIYVPSPGATRLSRATSAPLATFGRRGGSGMPRLPPRLPTREDSFSASVDGGSVADSSKVVNNHPSFFVPLPSMSRTASSPRLPTRSYESSPTTVDSSRKSIDLTRMERNASAATTSTAATAMPKKPCRYSSISEGLDAIKVLGVINTTTPEQDEDVGFDASAEEQQIEQSREEEATTAKCRPTPSRVISLSDPQDSATSFSCEALEPPQKQLPAPSKSQSSLSWTRFKQLAATSSQHTNAASNCCSEDRVEVRRTSSRTSLRGSRREIFARQGLSHLHVSCVTLDSALVDESHEWTEYDEDEETCSLDESALISHEEKSARSSKSRENKGVPETIVVDSKKLADANRDTGVYSGSISRTDNLPNGTGIMHYDNGKYYKGEWEDGNWHGTGLLLSANGDRYQGDFVHSTRHGYGVYSYDNGDTYDGAFNADKPHGIGIFKFADHSVYQGGFKFGSFDGQGWYEFDGGRYDGEWKGGCYDGNGSLQFGDGARYTGQFQSGKAHGLGEEVSANGVRRKGQWKHGDFIKTEENS